ncbi:MAG: exodeoxyribonuclease VII small subunit [Chitinophagales bacterium]|nr:exodeoxyribonuclease VII small subunit [Chitinophagales bacterium]
MKKDKKSEAAPESYAAAYAELQEIVQALQSDAVGVDALSDQIARAAILIEYCRKRLRATEDELEKLK